MKTRGLRLALGLVLSVGTLTSLARADEASVNQEALQKTVQMLNDPQARKAAADTPEAAAALSKVEAIAGSPQNTEAMMKVSSEIFEGLVKQSGGDSLKLQKLLIDAQKNPEAFANSLSPDARQKIRNIAENSPMKAKP